MTDTPPPPSEIILYQTEDGRARIPWGFENETQGQIAELSVAESKTSR